MAEYAKLWDSRGDVIAELRKRQETAFSEREELEKAALTLQRHYRGSLIRSRVYWWHLAVNEIQRVFRAHRGRGERNRRFVAREVSEETRLRSWYAREIQRVFRGYYSRMYRHDMGMMRKYVSDVVAAGEEQRRAAEEAMAEAEERRAKMAEERARAKFAEAAQGLHHLVSTASQPGVFRPAYAGAAVPTAFGVPVETHLHAAVRTFTRTRGLDRSRWPKTLTEEENFTLRALKDIGGAEAAQRRKLEASREGATRASGLEGADAEAADALTRTKLAAVRPGNVVEETLAVEEMSRTGAPRALVAAALAGGAGSTTASAAASLARRLNGGSPKRSEKDGKTHVHSHPPTSAPEPLSYAAGPSRSVRASDPHGSKEELERQERRLNKLRQLDERAFTAGGRVKPPVPTRGIAQGDPYEEPWKRSRPQREILDGPQGRKFRVGGNFVTAMPKGGNTFHDLERKRVLSSSSSSIHQTRAVHTGQGNGPNVTVSDGTSFRAEPATAAARATRPKRVIRTPGAPRAVLD